MRVFVTGASGWIGSAVVSDLIEAGHEVVGLARSDASADAVKDAGAEVVRGSLDDLDTLARAAADADGVIHTAYIHDFSQMEAAAATDRGVIEALGAALEGSGSAAGRHHRDRGAAARPSGHRGRPPRPVERPATRGATTRPWPSDWPSAASGCPSCDRRRRCTATGDHGFVARLVEIARERGASGYVGDGANRWAAVHRLDAARLYRLALEQGPAGGVYHAVGDEGVATRDIAEVIARHLDLPLVSVDPEQASDHFGWLGAFFSWDAPASNALTRERLGWEPTHQGLIADLEAGFYFTPGGRRRLT